MTKLPNDFLFKNTHFPPEFGSYLFQNGFAVEQVGSVTRYTKGKKLLLVNHSTVDVYENNPVDTDPANRWLFIQQISLHEQPHIIAWIQVLDSLGVQSASEFADNAAKIDEQLGVEARFIMQAYSSRKNVRV